MKEETGKNPQQKISPKNTLRFEHGRSRAKESKENVPGKCSRDKNLVKESAEKSPLQKRKRLCKKQSGKNKRGYPSKKSAWKKHQPERTPREAPRLRALEKSTQKRSRKKPPKRQKGNLQKAPAKKQTRETPAKEHM